LTLDQGKPLSESRDEVAELVQYWRNAAEDAKRLEGRVPNSVSGDKRVLLLRRPRGVIGVITPWNWPYTMPAELIAPALACGNTLVWTPASTTAVAGTALAECVAEADLPAGVLPLRRSELHSGRAPARAPRRARGVRGKARAARHGARSPRRPLRGDHHDGPAQQRGRGGEDGRARLRCARARRAGRARWRARERLSDNPLLAADHSR